MSAILSRTTERSAFRRAVRLPCQVVQDRGFRLVSDLALDLSTEGMRVTTRERVLTGEEVLVSFRSQRLNEWFDLEGTVARVIHGRRAGDASRCLGIAFGRIDDGTRYALFEALRGLPPPLPQRPALA
jgi:hypothetical protein